METKEKKKEPKKVDKSNIIYSIDEQNKLCVDCGAENPTKVSINNGVIICDSCSKEHEALGSSISFLKNINDDYDEFLINFIVMGSNTKFKRFLLQEKVDSNLPIKTKYKKHKNKVNFIKFNPVASNIMCSSTLFREVHIWDSIKFETCIQLPECKYNPTSIHWSQDGNLIGISTKKEFLNIFDSRQKNIYLKNNSMN